jgi:predicted metal-dependent phosphoesterase TrpH
MKTVADLHMHTTHSDGTLTPFELARLAREQAVDAVALTDHDTVSGLEDLIREAEKEGLEVLPGIELSARFSPGTLHLLGYGFDFMGPIAKKLEVFQTARAERNPLILQKLKELGMPLTLEEVKELSHAQGQVGRPHIAKALEAKGYVESYEVAFRKYLTKGAPAYVAKASWEAKECIDMIHDSGGAVVVAHPIQMKLQGGDLRAKVAELAEMGLDGLEVVHPDHKPQDKQVFRELAAEFSLLTTGGSDFHGKHKPGIQLGQGRPPYENLERLRERIAQRRKTGT